MNPQDEHLQAAAELQTTRIALGFALAAIAQPSAWVSLDMLTDVLDRSASPGTATMRALASIAADALRDRLLGELAFAGAAALVVLNPFDC